MRKKFTGVLFAAAALCLLPNSASAIPVLQLDIDGGIYDGFSDTIVTPQKSFSLYALFTPTAWHTLSSTYYVSAALTPQTSAAGSFGSFTFDGTVVDVTAGMDYGVPPLEANLSHDYRDMQPHGIFPTYFREFEFVFDSANQMTAYDSRDRAKNGGVIDTTYNPDGTMYYARFDVDVNDLAKGYYMHFDLYNTAVKLGDVDVNKYAPFTHDAETVPEPTTLLLMGAGLTGLYITRKLRKK